jgi:3'-phosphoadenosine 5'-phosphosulfate sulfotransferase (PAPS reductase)/FAD synthetase
MDFADIFARHERIALQVSGGRDSLACLYLLRPYWDRLTVYWLNTGAPFPETVEVMAQVRAQVPRFVEIDGRQPQVIAQFGMPSDLVPTSRTQFGLMATASTATPLQDRNDCCARVIMAPMHQRVLGDGCTLIIRGQRADDTHKAPIRSGHVENGVELLFPIEGWSAADVMAFLQAEGAPIPRFYETLAGAPDCMTCSAWWEHGVGSYLRQHHPEAHADVQRRLDIIRIAMAPHIGHFNVEVGA